MLVFFFLVNDNARMTFDARVCMLCYSNHVLFFNPIMKLKECPIFYYKTSGIICLRKHIEADNFKNLNFFSKKFVLKFKEILKVNLLKKKKICQVCPFYLFIIPKESFKKDNMEQ